MNYLDMRIDFRVSVLAAVVFGALTALSVDVANSATTEIALVPQTKAAELPLSLKGVNLAGGENDYTYPGIAPGTHLEQFPPTSMLDHWSSLGLRTIRLPFQPSDVQASPLQPLIKGKGTPLDTITKLVDYARVKGMYIILDPHAYGYMPLGNGKYGLINSTQMPTSAFVDFWVRLATTFKSYPNVIFGLMNEPKDQTPQQWHDAAVAAVNGIRTVAPLQIIAIPGTYYTGAHNWVSSGNAAVWTGFKDTGPFLFEMHEYMDSDFSGTHTNCSNSYAAMTAATSWLRSNRYKALIGEVAYSQDASCNNNGPGFFASLSQDSDVWLGWTWWGAGVEFGSNYIFNLNPNSDGTDQPQVKILTKNLSNTFLGAVSMVNR